MPKQLLALLVAPPDSESLQRRLWSLGVNVLETSSCADACRILEQDAPVDVVFAGIEFSDGKWLDVLRAATRNRPGGRLVVCLRQVDGGWIDLLESGACAVLVQPYSCGYLERILSATQTASDRTLAFRGLPEDDALPNLGTAPAVIMKPPSKDRRAWGDGPLPRETMDPLAKRRAGYA